jgi:hypothetical protein
MDDGVSLILSLTDVSGDGVSVSYETDGNPFSVPSAAQLFSDRRSINSRRRAESEAARHRTLIERTDQTRPRVPPCETRATALGRSDVGSSLAGRGTSRSRRATSHELRDDKRDVYRLQLFLDRKHEEMRHLEQQQRRAEQELAIAVQQISGVEDMYKKRQTRIEAGVAQHRRAADTAFRRRLESKSQWRTALEEKEPLRANIYRNEEEIAMQQYRKFLRRFVSGECELLEYFHERQVLFEEVHRIEMVNLLLIQGYKDIDTLLQCSLGKFKCRLEQLDETEKVDLKFCARSRRSPSSSTS